MIPVIAGTMDDTEAPGFRFDPLSGEPLCQQWGSGGPGPSLILVTALRAIEGMCFVVQLRSGAPIGLWIVRGWWPYKDSQRQSIERLRLVVAGMPIMLAPQSTFPGLYGLNGRKHTRRVVHPARPAGPVSEGAGQAGAEW